MQGTTPCPAQSYHGLHGDTHTTRLHQLSDTNTTTDSEGEACHLKSIIGFYPNRASYNLFSRLLLAAKLQENFLLVFTYQKHGSKVLPHQGNHQFHFVVVLHYLLGWGLLGCFPDDSLMLQVDSQALHLLHSRCSSRHSSLLRPDSTSKSEKRATIFSKNGPSTSKIHILGNL